MKFFRIILGTILIFSITFSIFFGFKKIGEPKVSAKEKQKDIIVGWQIDTFEGGVGSRRNFLMSVAKEFETANNNYLFMINQYTALEANERINKGILPDFISFSSGVNVMCQQNLKTEYYSVGGMVGNKTYAVPWCRGGYVLISKKDNLNDISFDKLITSSMELNLSKLAFLEEGYSASEYEYYAPKVAYQNFLSKDCVLLGTQRDVIRLENNNINCFYKPLSSFNDMFQYISITSAKEEKITAVNNFINYLLSEKVQNRLTSIKMFSCISDLEYENSVLQQMQNITDFGTISVFMAHDNYVELKQKLKKVQSDKDLDYNKIKNLIVYP